MNIKRTTARETTLAYTDDEREAITTALKDVAVALASYWDVLRFVETSHSTPDVCVEVETTSELLSELASNLDVPPSQSQITDDDAWQAFLAHAAVKAYDTQKAGV